MNPIDGVHEFSAYSGDEDFYCDQCDCAKEIGEDEEKSFEKNVQTITDKHIATVDEKVSTKEKEIMTI